MSCYEWERATIKLASAEFPKFRRAMVDAHNAARLAAFTLATKVYEALLAQGRGKRGFNHREAFAAQFERLAPRDRHEDLWYVVEHALFPKGNVPARPVAPKKSAFGFLPLRADSIRCGEAHIGFDAKTCTLRYGVPENNHACDTAGNHPVVRAMFSRLDAVVWGRGQGGVLVGNNEYNRESECVGGGGNIEKAAWGPLGGKPCGKSERQLREETERRHYAAMGGGCGRFVRL